MSRKTLQRAAPSKPRQLQAIREQHLPTPNSTLLPRHYLTRQNTSETLSSEMELDDLEIDEDVGGNGESQQTKANHCHKINLAADAS